MSWAPGALAAGTVVGLCALVGAGVLVVRPPWAEAVSRDGHTGTVTPVVVTVSVPAPDPASAPISDPQGAVPQEVPPQEVVPPEVVAADPVWVKRTAAAAGVPERALAGYAAAELRLAREQPGCHLPWTALAGIGWVESHHGTIGGRVLGGDGRPEWRDGEVAASGTGLILGIALTGETTATITDTDSGLLDGDDRWDRAVGPMQFIPSTWRAWEADGDGDGRADPQDIDDASLAAARYLCASGQDVRAAAAWGQAVLSYNRSTVYAQAVTVAANTYASRGRA